MIKDGKSISWTHIVSTVKNDKERQLNMLYKIREEHINLSPQLRMRVKLAAQILSSTMSHALLANNQAQFSGTVEFCDIFDQWFDC